jgi:hypothetical protein
MTSPGRHPGSQAHIHLQVVHHRLADVDRLSLGIQAAAKWSATGFASAGGEVAGRDVHC